MIVYVPSRQPWVWLTLSLAAVLALACGQSLAVDRGTDKGRARVCLLEARAARLAGDYDKAEQLLKQCQELGGSARDLQLERALLQAQHGDLDDVEKDLKAIVASKNHVDGPLVLKALIRGYLASFRLAEAARTLEAWLERKPKDAAAVYWLGRVKETGSNHEGAADAYRRALKLDPGLDRVRLHLGGVLLQQARPTDALELFRPLQKRLPGSVDVLLGLARCYHQLGRLDDARRFLEGLLKKHPRHVTALVERARLDLEAGRLQEGIAGLRKAIALKPQDRQANYLMAQSLRQVGRQAEAEQFLVRVKRITADLEHLQAVQRKLGEVPNAASLRHELGTILLRIGEDKAGVRWLQRALKVDPTHRPTHLALADYYDRVGDKEAAARHRRLARD